jgi:hypothetical protein
MPSIFCPLPLVRVCSVVSVLLATGKLLPAVGYPMQFCCINAALRRTGTTLEAVLSSNKKDRQVFFS